MMEGRFYKDSKIAKKRNISLQRVHALGKKMGWGKHVGVFYDADSVDEYEEISLRTELSKKLGWTGRGLIKDDSRDKECPECGGFAVEAPATIEEMKSARWLRAEWNWLCTQGHKGK